MTEKKNTIVFKAIPRLLEMIEPSPRAKAYVAKLVEQLKKEGYFTDAKIAMDYLKIMNGEKVGMATMDFEAVIKDMTHTVQSEEFKKVYEGKSLGEVIPVDR